MCFVEAARYGALKQRYCNIYGDNLHSKILTQIEPDRLQMSMTYPKREAIPFFIISQVFVISDR